MAPNNSVAESVQCEADSSSHTVLNHESELSDEEQVNDNCVHKLQMSTVDTCKKYSAYISKCVMFVCLLAYTVYFGFAVSYSVEMARALIVITGIVLLCIVYVFVRDHYGQHIYMYCMEPVLNWLDTNWHVLKW